MKTGRNWLGLRHRRAIQHSARAAIAGVLSLIISRQFKLPQAYWAPFTTLVVIRSNLGAEWAISWQRFVGTAIGASLAALLATHFGESAIVFGIGVFVLGLLCVAFHVEEAFTIAAIALAIVLLVPRSEPGWAIALHRFIEVSIGIAVALAMAWIWPEKD